MLGNDLTELQLRLVGDPLHRLVGVVALDAA